MCILFSLTTQLSLSSKFVPVWFYIPNFPRFNGDPHGTASSTSSGESAPSTTLASTSSSSFTSSPCLGAISAETVTGHFPSFSAVAPSDVGGFSGEQSAKFFQQQVWQFQRGLFHDKCAIDSNIDLDCRSSSLAGSVTVPSFLSTYLSVGIPVVLRASRPGSVGTILGTIDQQPDLGAFSRESICSWPRLRANPGKTAGQNHQWRLR